MTDIDEYHDNFAEWLVNTSDTLDNYFIDSNKTTHSKTYAEVKTSCAFENSQKSEYALRLKIRINLPKLQDKLRIVFEDATSDDELYDGTKLNNNYEHLENQSYSFRLEYFNYIIKKFRIIMGVGARFKKFNLQPYLNMKVKYKIEDTPEHKESFFNRFRYYSDGDIENTTLLKSLYILDNNFFFTLNNSFRYRNWTSKRDIVNDASFVRLLRKKEQVSIGASITSKQEKSNIYVEYYQLYHSYRNLLYKDWVYYELLSSVLKRRENDYHDSYRFMFNIGAVFGKD
ncbi:MAG: hypothetical protein GXO60_05355 [Epsilonproteobacteria bacterium]|nr:hypothetical protein [Campylobacterota bacterium]